MVPVLMTNCHVSEKPNSGPLIAHSTTMPAANMKVDARPAANEVRLASSPKNLETSEECSFVDFAVLKTIRPLGSQLSTRECLRSSSCRRRRAPCQENT